jgi:hypothetical protein
MDLLVRDGAPSPALPLRRVAIRPLAVPVEHGGWGFLLEPLVLALFVAPSAAGALLAVAASGAFLTRHPLKLAVRDLSHRKSYPRTRVCLLLAAGYGSATLALAAAAVALSQGGLSLLFPLLLAVPLAGLQFRYDVQNRTRELVSEMSGALAAGAGGAACILAGNGSWRLAAMVWLLMVLRAAPSVLYVRALVRRGGHAPQLFAHAVALAIIAATPLTVARPILLPAVFSLVFVRAAAGALRSAVRPAAIGVEEIAWGVVTVAACVAALAG